jgi:hypothetical protein
MNTIDYIMREANDRIAEVGERQRALQAHLDGLTVARHMIQATDADQLIYDVLIDDRSSMVYSSKEESYQAHAAGLETAVKLAEERFERRYGNIRTDGWVRYKVTVRFGSVDLRVPHEAYQAWTKQSLKSLKEADNK